MTDTLRWLDELPVDAPERELLVAGKGARPPAGVVDAEWQALCLALAATAGASGAVATGIGANSVAAQSASGVVATKATAVTSWIIGAKWFVEGAALGCGVAGAGAVVQHVGGRVTSVAPQQPALVTARRAAPNAHGPNGGGALAPSAVDSSSGSSASSLVEPARVAHAGARPDASPHAELALPSAPGVASAEFPAPPAPATAPLAAQARELAEVKRLIDAGASAEALRRLDATRRAGVAFALGEERDALYVQALDKARRRADARLGAEEFLRRYPRSPYLETMRRLLAAE